MEPHAPDSYERFLADLKRRIHAAQLRASVAVNREVVLLYWQIGRDILERQQRETWGAKVIDRLAAGLKREFPKMKGFSVRNLKYMRRFAEIWNEDEIVQQVAAQLPWFHNCVLLDKLGDMDERIWYARAAIHHGWSRAVLVHQIESDLRRRQGKTITNLDRKRRARSALEPSSTPRFGQSESSSPIQRSPRSRLPSVTKRGALKRETPRPGEFPQAEFWVPPGAISGEM